MLRNNPSPDCVGSSLYTREPLVKSTLNRPHKSKFEICTINIDKHKKIWYNMNVEEKLLLYARQQRMSIRCRVIICVTPKKQIRMRIVVGIRLTMLFVFEIYKGEYL